MVDRQDADAEALAFIAEHTSDVIVRSDRSGLLTYVSPSIRRYGYEPSDMVGKPFPSFAHPDDLPVLRANTEALFAGVKDPSAHRLHRFRTGDGRWLWAEGAPHTVTDAQGQIVEIINIFRDVTARVVQAEAASEEARQFEAAFRHAAIGKALVGLDGAFMRVNDAFCRIVGYTEAEALALNFQTLTHPADLDADLEHLRALTAGEIESYRLDKRYVRKDGGEVWAHLAVAMVRGDDGAPCHYVAQVEDLTERRSVQAALQASEARYRLLAENSEDVTVQISLAGEIRYVSPAVRAHGYEPEEIEGRSIQDLIHPDDLDQARANLAAALGGQPSPNHLRQLRFRTAGGQWVCMEGNARPLRDGSGAPEGFVTTLRDVTERLEQEALFKAAFEHAAIAKSMVGLDGRLLWVNEAACRLTGFNRDDLIGTLFHDLVHPDETGMDAAKIEQLRQGQSASYVSERRFSRSDGRYVRVRQTVSLARYADGRPKYYLAEIEDLTEQHAAEAALKNSEERYRLIAENTSDMIIMSDLDGVAAYVSPSVRASGFQPEELQGRSFRDNVHPDDIGHLGKAFRRLLAGEEIQRVRWRGRGRGVAGDGWTWLESNPSLMRDPRTGEATGYLDIIRNVHHQVEQEEALAAARAAAEAAAAAKSQFLANMSHEIRTPLTAVLGFTGLLAETPGLPAAATGHVERISAAGKGLLAIVNDILDFSKLEAGKFEIRPVPTDIAAVCQESLLLFSGQAEAKGLALAFEAAPGLSRSAMMDGDRLRQTLINLVGNAVKFTEAGVVTLSVGEAGPDRVSIDVSDTGPGLDAEAQAQLFQRFTQIDGSMNRRHGGTGLGLAICRGIAEAMGGEIAVTSTPGRGATFRLTLPAPPVDAWPAEEEEVGAQSIDGLCVFLVDDNATNRELGRRILEAAGAVVHEAADGAEAVARLAVLPADVVLMDLRMPGLDGRGALARLRAASGPNQRTPVLAFTADAEMRSDGDLDGFDGLVRKPIQPMEMYAAILEAALRSPVPGAGPRAAAG